MLDGINNPVYSGFKDKCLSQTGHANVDGDARIEFRWGKMQHRAARRIGVRGCVQNRRLATRAAAQSCIFLHRNSILVPYSPRLPACANQDNYAKVKIRWGKGGFGLQHE